MADPVISTVPTISFTKGTTGFVSVASYITDADTTAGAITTAYTGAGLPAGVTFNAALKRYEYDGSGDLNTTEATNSAQFSASDDPVSGFGFAELPEFVFIRGFAETEQLGCFHKDHGNRWLPGDLHRLSGWTPRNSVTLVVDSGVQPANLTYNASTAELVYTAGETVATANLTLTCHLTDGTVDSDSFRIRILSPTRIYGDNASTYPVHPGWNTTPGRHSGTWLGTGNLGSALSTTATDNAPNVVLALGGTYSGTSAGGTIDFFIGNNRNFLYLLGDPTDTPTWEGDLGWGWNTTSSGADALLYIKGMNWRVMSFDIGPSAAAATTKVYITKMFLRDRGGNNDGWAYSNQEYDETDSFVYPGNRITHAWAFETFATGGNDTTHAFYMHGRPGGEAYFNNYIMRGGDGCQQLKGTLANMKYRNGFQCTVEHPPYVPASSAVPTLNDMTIGERSTNLIDQVNVANITIYNCHLIGAMQAPGSVVNPAFIGTQNGIIFLRARREMHSSDVPAYPNVNYDAGTTSVLDGGYFTDDPRYTWVDGFDGSTTTFKSDTFWNAVAAEQPDITSYAQALASPYTFKHFVSYCKFEYLIGGSGTSVYAQAIRNDGTYPRRVPSQFGSSIIERAPTTWRERAADFYANNFFTGWTSYRIGDNSAFSLLNYDSAEAISTVEAGAQWPRDEADEFPQYYIIGGHGYGTQAEAIALPAGFET
jgi:hypothetical protein